MIQLQQMPERGSGPLLHAKHFNKLLSLRAPEPYAIQITVNTTVLGVHMILDFRHEIPRTVSPIRSKTKFPDLLESGLPLGLETLLGKHVVVLDYLGVHIKRHQYQGDDEPSSVLALRAMHQDRQTCRFDKGA